jgi:hypothetical protein
MGTSTNRDRPPAGLWSRQAAAAILAACALLPGRWAAAATFNYLASPVDVTPGTTGAWTDVDVSGSAPSGATGVIVQVLNTSSSNYHYGVRNNGSSDAWMLTGSRVAQDTQMAMFMVGVDSSRIFEVYMENSAVKTYLIGYTGSGATFFTNGVDKSTATTGSYVDIDISGDTGADTAIGGIFLLKNTAGSSRDYALRKNGSTDDRYTGLIAGSATGALIGVDGSEICEQKISNTSVDVYLVGYVTSGAVLFTNGVDKSTATTGSYQDIDITANIGSDDASGALLEMNDAGGRHYTAIRPNGASYDYYGYNRHNFNICAIDSGDILEQKIANTAMDVWLTGYTLAVSTPTISSAANQTFIIGDPATAISTITVAGGDAGNVTAADDIRIRIPAGFNMVWDSSDTTATIGGGAAGKVSTTVSYEDSDATLVLDVTSDFAASESVTVAGLSFTDFTAESSADNLDLETGNDGAVTDTDDKTVSIIEPPCETPFCFLDAPVDVSPGTAGSWQDVDVSAWLPASATGAVLEVFNTTGSGVLYGVRKNGSTDTWMTGATALRTGRRTFLMIGVDASRILEVYMEDAAVDTYLTGYTTTGVTFFTNAVDKSLSTTGSWLDVDISGDTGADTAIGAIFILRNTSTTDYQIGLRKKGSTDSRLLEQDRQVAFSAMIGVDADEIAQMQIASTNLDAYLVGYVTEGAVFFTNAVDVSTATTASYVDTDITANIGANDANGAILELANTDASDLYNAFRPNGATHDHYYRTEHCFGVVGIDDGDVFEQKVETTAMDVYLLGYTLVASGGTDVTNYRSVGTNSGSLYSTGVASISSGTSAVTFGGGASLPANVGQGDKLTIGGTDFHIFSRDSATQATVQETAASTLTNQAYTIMRAYNDFQSWETARQGDLVTDMRVEVAVAWDDGDFTGAVTIDGSTTDATHYLRITVPAGQRHAGQSGAGAVLDMNNAGTGITISDDYTRIEWLQVRRTGGADNRSAVEVSNATGILVENLLIYDFGGASTLYGVRGGTASGATLRNCIVYDGIGRGIVADSASSTLTVQNCTVYGVTGRGVSRVSGALTATNTIAMECTVEDFGSALTQSYNMSSDASASGTGSLPARDPVDEFVYVLAGNVNLHLKAGSDAIDAGSDLSGSFTSDVDNGTRAAPWDIGADESGVTGTGQKQTPRVATWREAAP